MQWEANSLSDPYTLLRKICAYHSSGLLGWKRLRERMGTRNRVSFYLIPIQITKMEAELEVDFSGERKAFGVQKFSKGAGYFDKDAPAFVRLDEYDDPSEPDAKALAALLAREYPDYFGGN